MDITFEQNRPQASWEQWFVTSNVDEVQILNNVHSYALKVSKLKSRWSGLETICKTSNLDEVQKF